MGELVEKSVEGSCLCFVGQPEVAVSQQRRHQQEERDLNKAREEQNPLCLCLVASKHDDLQAV